MHVRMPARARPSEVIGATTSRLAGAGLAVALALGACGGGPAPSPAVSPELPGAVGSDEPGPEGLALPRCDDMGLIQAPADWYRDAPVYVSNEMPVDAVRAWAQSRPGFAEIWIDRDHQGWISVGFTGEARARQAELLEAFPDVGAVAVEVPHTAAELDALQASLRPAWRDLGIVMTSAGVHRGVVSVGLEVLEPERVAALAARFPGAPLCVEGLDPALAPAPGPQAPGGDGWRLLGYEAGAGPGYRTGIATTPEQLVALWADAGLPGEAPAVDFTTEVALWFAAVTGSSCPDIRLDGIAADPGRSLVWPEIARLDGGACTADIYPHAYVVAVRRDRLPAAPFGIQLGPDDPPGGVPEERTIVDAPVQLPGVVAGPGDIHQDPALLHPEPAVAEPGDTVEPGFEPPFRFPLACGVEWLGPLNDTWWRTADPAAADGAVPGDWAALADNEGRLLALISVRTDPAELVVTAGDRSLTYAAFPGQPDCP